jgi:hypothetical protein
MAKHRLVEPHGAITQEGGYREVGAARIRSPASMRPLQRAAAPVAP